MAKVKEDWMILLTILKYLVRRFFFVICIIKVCYAMIHPKPCGKYRVL